METAFNTSLVLLVILDTVLVMAYARIFARGPGGAALFVRPLLLSVVALHFVSIALRSFMVGACPLGSRAEFLALVAFSIVLIYLVIELRIGERATGVFAITPSFVLQVVATVSLLSSVEPPKVELGVPQSVHSLAAIVGFSGVALCNVYGILYLFLYWAIKRGSFGLYYRKMPSLETLSDLNFVAMWIAFLALTVTVGTGVWGHFVAGSDDSIPLVQAEIVLTSLLWLLYGSAVFARHFLGLGGKRLAYTTVMGIFLLAGIFLGGFFAQGFHR